MAANEDLVLQQVNAQMRRIDLFASWLPPSQRVSLCSRLVDIHYQPPLHRRRILLIAKVFHQVRTLADPRASSVAEQAPLDEISRAESTYGPHQKTSTLRSTLFSKHIAPISSSLRPYVRQPVFLPLLSSSLLYLAVL